MTSESKTLRRACGATTRCVEAGAGADEVRNWLEAASFAPGSGFGLGNITIIAEAIQAKMAHTLPGGAQFNIACLNAAKRAETRERVASTVRELVLPKMVAALEAAGVGVFEPFSDNNEGASNASEQSAYWAYRIGQADVEAVRRCEAVVDRKTGETAPRQALGVQRELGS